MDATLRSALLALLAEDAPADAPAAPAVAAPAVARIASPFAAAGKAAGPATLADKARVAHPNDRHAQRVYIALTREPGWTCDVDAVATLPDGTEVPSALHGFTVPKATGTPCPGIYGIPKGEACPGKVR